MTDNRSNLVQGNGASLKNNSETICIDTFRVLDSCRDRDCYEDVRVYTDATGQAVIDSTCNIRITNVEIVSASISVDEIPFNECFYSLDIRYYILITAEGCTGAQGGRQTFYGVSVVPKKVVLFGGEGNVTVFKSTDSSFCNPEVTVSNNLPVGVVETVSPIALSTRLIDCSEDCPSALCCECSEIPNFANPNLGPLVDPDTGNNLYVSLGIFSVVRIERPSQYLISATGYAVPEKECIATSESDPCSLFRNMAFPVDEFSPIGNCTPTSTPNSITQARCSCRTR